MTAMKNVPAPGAPVTPEDRMLDAVAKWIERESLGLDASAEIANMRQIGLQLARGPLDALIISDLDSNDAAALEEILPSPSFEPEAGEDKDTPADLFGNPLATDLFGNVFDLPKRTQR